MDRDGVRGGASGRWGARPCFAVGRWLNALFFNPDLLYPLRSSGSSATSAFLLLLLPRFPRVPFLSVRVRRKGNPDLALGAPSLLGDPFCRGDRFCVVGM